MVSLKRDGHRDTAPCLLAQDERAAGGTGRALAHVVDADRAFDEFGRREFASNGSELFGGIEPDLPIILRSELENRGFVLLDIDRCDCRDSMR